LKLPTKKAVAGGALLLSLVLIVLGVLLGEPKIVWSNGKILCLTCIGIK